MPAVAVDAAALLLVALVLLGRPPVALAALLGTAVLVPATFVVPHTHFSYLTVQHVLALAAAGRLLLHWLHGRIRTEQLRSGPVLVALGLVVTTSFVVGLVASPGNRYSIGQTARMLDLATQVVFLLVCVVLIRQLGSPWRALQIAAGVVTVSAGIGFVEHLSNHAWGHWLFSLLPDRDPTNAAQALDFRAGQPRVRAGAEFALQFAWMSATLLAAVVVAVARSRGGRFAAVAAAGFVLTAVYWSYSRSALGFGLVALLLLALLLRDTRVVSVLLVAAVAVLVAYRLHPSVTAHLSAATDENSLSIRLDRLHLILPHLARHPFRGVGLGNLNSTGVRTTDNALLLEYAEVGAFGLVALALLYLVVVAQTARAAVVARTEDRPVAVACLVGAVAYVVGTQFYDAFTLIQGPQVLWFLVALATVVADRAGAPIRLPRPSRELLLGAAAVAVAVGGAVVSTAADRVQGDYVMTTLPVSRDVVTYDPSVAGKRLVTTACAEAVALTSGHSDVDIGCYPVLSAAGVAHLHLEAPSRDALSAAEHRIVAVVTGRGGVGAMRLHGTTVRAFRSPLPLSAAVLVPGGVLGLLLLVPWRRERAEPAMAPEEGVAGQPSRTGRLRPVLP